MNIRIKSILLAVLSALTGTLLALAAEEEINAIVAIVNDESITRLEVEREAKRLQNISDKKIETAALRQTALDELIDRRIQLQLARRLNISIADKMVEQRLEGLQKEFGLADESALQEAAQSRFLMTYPEFRKRVREDLQIQTLFYRQIFSRVQVFEDEIKQFLKSQPQLSSERQYLLRYILITVSADGADLEEKQALIASVHADIIDGADFSELAVQYSDDESAAAGGNLGFKKESQLPEAFLVEVHNLNPGDVSEPISTLRGFHLLKLEDLRGGEISKQVNRFLLSHIFFAENDEERVYEVHANITDEATFEQGVIEHSLDKKSTDRQGIIGWFYEEDIPSYFVEAVAQMKTGDVSAPIKSPFGWHILYLRDVHTEGVDIQKLREQARQALRERRAFAQRDVWLRRLRSGAHIRILDTAFELKSR